MYFDSQLFLPKHRKTEDGSLHLKDDVNSTESASSYEIDYPFRKKPKAKKTPMYMKLMKAIR